MIRPREACRQDRDDWRVRETQRVALQRTFDASAERLIVFTIPGADPETGIGLLSGGAMSISAICDETARFRSLHGSEVILCTAPGETPFLRHTLFPSSRDVYTLGQVLTHFRRLRSLTLHVPEYLASSVVSFLDRQQLRCLAGIEHVHLNVMNQNIDLLPEPDVIAGLRRISSLLTMTTAHEQYCTEELSMRYGIPVHYLAVPIDVHQYRSPPYSEREDLALFSPDDPGKNDAIAKLLAERLPQLETVVVSGIPYRNYRALLERAKWLFTFGEGLDYYFVESILSGGVAIAVFNDRFFTPEFGALDTVYASFEDLHARIVEDIARLNRPDAYEQYRRHELSIVSAVCSLDRFRGNLERFLRGEYTWPALRTC